MKDMGQYQVLVDRYYCPLLLSLNHQKEHDFRFFHKITKLNGKFSEGILINGRFLCFLKKDIRFIAEEVSKMSPIELLRTAKNCVHYTHKLISSSRKLSKKNPNLKVLRAYKKAVSEMTPFLNSIVIIEKELEKRAKLVLIKNRSIDLEEDYNAIIFPRKKTEQVLERISLLNVALGKNSLKKHAQKYSWLGTKYSYEDDFTIKDFRDRLKFMKNPKKEILNINKLYNESERKTKEILRQLKFNKEDRLVIDSVKEFVFLRTFRSENLCKSYSLIRPMFKKIASKNDLSFEEIRYYMVSDVENLIKTGKKIDINKRIEGFVVYWKNGKSYMYTGIKKEMFKEPVKHQSAEVKGDPACKGKARGKVRIVITADDAKKVRIGDIMVAVMTFPHFIAAMERAAAFVTDEGGILCHAAIVSREMDKPCIIGTKNATSILKDGDFVEVDAYSGIVKILKRAKKK